MSSEARTADHAAIIYNPVTVPLDRMRDAVEEQEERRAWSPSRWIPTDRYDSGRSAACRALATSPSVIIVAGGDGTVRAVAGVVLDSGTPLALLPSGTGNLLARNLGLPLGNVTAAVEAAFGGLTRPVDVGVVEFEDEKAARSAEIFLVMAGIGLDAEMARTTRPRAKRFLGWLAYVPAIARSVLANRPLDLTYRVDDGPTRTARAHTVIIGNCGTLTGGMLLLPAASVDDGLLDVVMLRPARRIGWARIGTRLTVQGVAHRSRFGRGMLRRAPGLRTLAYAQGRRFEVRFANPHVVQLDGDSMGLARTARISLDHRALHVCVEDDCGRDAGREGRAPADAPRVDG
ncbi:transcriptional regulator [Brachybacterium avium]|uniref:Transcriptional regulator n=1 Tax=Brachybacterium avium TaxID=2017485 RepID=A0A220UCV4_9MICO|nr:diacylglycerol kinase family protein [Brachybacterium avium]ASK66038.1 transcriptional regulator [Brachybacterium avium]